jgi:arylsulfatase A-like enzyme
MRAALPPRPSFDERDVSDKPGLVKRRPRLDDGDLERIERDYRCGLASLLALDEAVASLVDELRGTGQLERTVIAFTADHGVLAGEHRIRRGKNRPYEEAIRVPLLVRGPGVAAGARVDAPVANVDTAPTILDLAGVTPPPELARPIDGATLAPLLAGGGGGARRAVLIEGRAPVSRSARAFKVRSYVGVRTARYAYFEHRRAAYPTRGEGIEAPIGGGRTTDRELYDLRRDPFELTSRDRDPRYADARRELSRVLAELERCSGPECVASASIRGPSG